MKLKDLKAYFHDRTLSEVEIDVTAVVVANEWRRPRTRLEEGDNFRKRVINSLLALRLPFVSDWNIGHDFRKQIISVTCPYCTSPMNCTFGGGSGNRESDTYTCSGEKCRAKVTLAYPLPGAVSVEPPKES